MKTAVAKSKKSKRKSSLTPKELAAKAISRRKKNRDSAAASRAKTKKKYELMQCELEMLKQRCSDLQEIIVGVTHDKERYKKTVEALEHSKSIMDDFNRRTMDALKNTKDIIEAFHE